MKVFFHSAASFSRGFYLVVSDSKNHEIATAMTFENGMDEETTVARVRAAFAALNSASSEKAA